MHLYYIVQIVIKCDEYIPRSNVRRDRRRRTVKENIFNVVIVIYIEIVLKKLSLEMTEEEEEATVCLIWFFRRKMTINTYIAVSELFGIAWSIVDDGVRSKDVVVVVNISYVFLSLLEYVTEGKEKEINERRITKYTNNQINLFFFPCVSRHWLTKSEIICLCRTLNYG